MWFWKRYMWLGYIYGAQIGCGFRFLYNFFRKPLATRMLFHCNNSLYFLGNFPRSRCHKYSISPSSHLGLCIISYYVPTLASNITFYYDTKDLNTNPLNVTDVRNWSSTPRHHKYLGQVYESSQSSLRGNQPKHILICKQSQLITRDTFGFEIHKTTPRATRKLFKLRTKSSFQPTQTLAPPQVHHSIYNADKFTNCMFRIIIKMEFANGRSFWKQKTQRFRFP
jgi:hypothetical protein